MQTTLMEVMLALGLMGDSGLFALDPQEVVCLAQNVYHEARGESAEGQRAVAFVTLNRVESDKYPDTICEVVYQPKQFSWTSQSAGEPLEPAAYETALMVALAAMTGLARDPTHGATHYYNDSKVLPRWSHALRTTAVIGAHTFKKEAL